MPRTRKAAAELQRQDFQSLIEKKKRIEKIPNMDELADRMGVSRDTMRKYKTDFKKMRIETVERLCRVLHITQDEIAAVYRLGGG